jgi:hypothetical protein
MYNGRVETEDRSVVGKSISDFADTRGKVRRLEGTTRTMANRYRKKDSGTVAPKTRGSGACRMNEATTTLLSKDVKQKQGGLRTSDEAQYL